MNRTVTGILFLAAGLALNACGADAPAPAEGKSKVILDFEDASIWMSENDSPFAAVAEHHTEGAKALKVQYTNKPEWSNVLTQKVPADWSGYGFLSFDVYLDGNDPVAFGMWIRDKALHKAEAHFQLGPGPNTITVSLDELKRTAELDRATVTSLCLYKECPQEITCYLDNMRISEKAPPVKEVPPVRMADDNVVMNGGFEETQKPDAVGSPFKGWAGRRWAGAGYVGAGKNAVFAGQSSGMVDGRDPVCDVGFVSQPIAVKFPTKVKLTAYVQGDASTKASLALVDTGERPIAGAEAKLPNGTYAWKKVELVCDIPNLCPAVKIIVRQNGTGRLWIDDVALGGVALETKNGLTVSETGKELKVDAPLVTETLELLAKRAAAQQVLAALKAEIAAAKGKGVETLYDEIPLMLGDLAFNVRWDIPEHATLRDGYCAYVQARATEAIAHLKAVESGQAPDLKVPPHPDFAKLKLKGRYYCEGDEPKILFSMQYHHDGELTKWFCPEGYDSDIPAVGATRYDFQKMPVWEAYKKYPDTHRVFDDSWCGHIIRDKYSDGGTDRCVISLDSPHMQEAIAKSIAIYAERIKARKIAPLYVNLGFEYSYVNYDSFSHEKFQNWLKRKYAAIDGLNKTWRTTFKDFSDVTLPSYDPMNPEPNPAKYYDWGDFNLWRFTDFMAWAKAEIRKALPEAVTTTGGGEPFGAGFWRQGIDEELLVGGVNDIFLSETGSRALGVTSVMDLQRSLAPNRLILDPEYHALANTCFDMFLHGCGVMDYWWWPDQMDGFYESSMKHSHLRTLPEVAKVMEVALDVRRLAKYITPFPDAPNEFALLYSRASLIQRFPGAQGNKTPYSLEVEKSYGAAVSLDAPVGFVSSNQVRAGIPEKLKVLVIPGARFMEEDVVAKIEAWAKKGGTVVITPTSLVADEYNRKRDYLGALGLEVTGEEVPEFMAGAAKRGIDQEPGENDFIQGPVVKTIVAKEPKRTIALGGTKLEAAGIIQSVKPSADWNITATYEDGSPAILSRKYDAGQIYYLAAQLDVASRRVFFNELMQSAGISRPIRALTPDGALPEGVESRTVPFGGGYLTYVVNFTNKPATVKLTSGKTFDKIHDVNADQDETGPELTLAPLETRILKISVKP